MDNDRQTKNAASEGTVDSFVRCIACDGRGMFHSKRAGAYEAICARCHGTGEEPNARLDGQKEGE